MAELLSIRSSIDNIDATLVYLLAERFKATQKVGFLKAAHQLPAGDPGRETAQIARLRRLAAEAHLDPAFAEKFLNFIIGEVIRHHEAIAEDHQAAPRPPALRHLPAPPFRRRLDMAGTSTLPAPRPGHRDGTRPLAGGGPGSRPPGSSAVSSAARTCRSLPSSRPRRRLRRPRPDRLPCWSILPWTSSPRLAVRGPSRQGPACGRDSALSTDINILADVIGAEDAPPDDMKIQLRGPLSLAAGLHLHNGERALIDYGARRDIAASLAAGVEGYLKRVAAAAPGARLVVQIDEPEIASVLAGTIPTSSGYRTLRSVPGQEADRLLAAARSTRCGPPAPSKSSSRSRKSRRLSTGSWPQERTAIAVPLRALTSRQWEQLAGRGGSGQAALGRCAGRG